MVGLSIAGAEVDQWRTLLWKQPYRITWPTAYKSFEQPIPALRLGGQGMTAQRSGAERQLSLTLPPIADRLKTAPKLLCGASQRDCGPAQVIGIGVIVLRWSSIRWSTFSGTTVRSGSPNSAR